MLHKIRDLIRPRKPTGFPYNLTDLKIERLRSLLGTKGHEELQKLLDYLSTLYAEALLQCRDDADIHYYRGLITGFRKAGTIVDEIVQEIDNNNARRADRADRDAARLTDARAAATFGSGYWGL